MQPTSQWIGSVFVHCWAAPPAPAPDPQLHLAPVLTDGPPTRDTSTFDGFFECGAEIEAHDLLLSGTIAKRVGMKVVP